MEFSILPMKIEDYEEVYALWQKSEGLGLSGADTKEGIDHFLQLNPGLSFTARSAGRLVGAAICGCDGRRGYLHHLAVEEDSRKNGIGLALVNACLAVLTERRIQKCHIFVYANNQNAIAFWEKTGWLHRTELILMSKNLP
jgi:N-acetylglutamate synthase